MAFFLLMAAIQGCFAEGEVKEEKLPAPEFTVKLFDGGEFRSTNFKGRPMVVNFYASWCVPCGDEAPYLEKSYLKHGKQGVGFVSIAVQDTREKALKFTKKHKLTLPAGIDESDVLYKAFKVLGVPTTYIIDKEGMISHTHLGAVTNYLLDDELEKIQ